MFIQNTMQRAYYFPAWQETTSNGEVVNKVDKVLIGPGESTNEVSKEHFDAVRKGNHALQALLDLRHLIVTEHERDGNVQLTNTELLPPPDLTGVPEGVKRNDKAVAVEVNMNDDGPAEATTRRGGKRS